MFEKGYIYLNALQNVEDIGPVNLMDLSGLSQAAIGYQPQRFIQIDPRLMEERV